MDERRVWHRREHRVTGLGSVGLARHRQARRDRLRPHRHPEHWELCFIAAGTVHWWVGSDIWELGPGSWYLTAPGREHGAVGAVMEPCRLGWLHLDRRARRWAGFSSAETAHLRQRLAGLPVHWTGEPRQWRCWTALGEALEAGDPLRAARRAVALQGLLLAALADAEGNARPHPSAAIARVLAHLAAHPERPVALAALARLAGLGRSRFAERFKEETGHSPAAYELRLRVRRAAVLLQDEDRRVTDIALDLGFASSQHFAQVFRGHTGLSPSAWRAALAGSGIST